MKQKFVLFALLTLSIPAFAQGQVLRDVVFQFPDLVNLGPVADNRATAEKDRLAAESLSGPAGEQYKRLAGIYLPEAESAETVSSRLLSLSARTKRWYSWGVDLPLSRTYQGTVDYSAAQKSLVAEAGNGGAQVLGATAKTPLPGWTRVGTPEQALGFYRSLVAQKKALNARFSGSFLGPEAAWAAVKDEVIGLLAAWKAVDRPRFYGYLSREKGLLVRSDEFGDRHFSADDLAANLGKNLGNDWLGFDPAGAYKQKDWELFGMQAKALVGAGNPFVAYPNLFLNENIEAVQRDYPGAILVELQASRPTKAGPLPTESILSLVLVKEGDRWKVASLRLSVDLR